MRDLILLDLLPEVVSRLHRMPREERARVLLRLIHQVGDVDAVLVPHGDEAHVDAVEGFGRAALRRAQIAGAIEDPRVRVEARRALQEVVRDLDQQVRAMTLVEQLDALTGTMPSEP